MHNIADVDSKALAALEAPNPDAALRQSFPHLSAAQRRDVLRSALEGRIAKVFADGVAKGWLRRGPNGTHPFTDAGRAAQASGEWERWFASHPAMRIRS